MHHHYTDEYIRYDYHDDNHLLIELLANIYTMSGFIVRTKYEIIPCEKCLAAIPTKMVYEKLKKKNLPVPEEWSNLCKDCKKPIDILDLVD